MSLSKSKYNVSPGKLNATLSVPASKSHANRMLILASVFPGEFVIRNLPESTDVLNLISALEQVGLKIIKEGSKVTVKNHFPECEIKTDNPLILRTGDGGTTNRFLFALLALGSRTYWIEAEGHMRNRPMLELEESLGELGVKIIKGKDSDPFWYSIQGPLKCQKKSIEVDAARSTQFPTALSLALAPQGIKVIAKNMESSHDYFSMTENLVKRFQQGLNIIDVPADFSSVGYPLALGALGGEVKIDNVNEIDPFQADSKFIKILTDMGVDIEIDKVNGLHLKGTDHLKPISVSGNDFPDLIPTLAFVASYAQGKSVLKDLAVLRHKECDRVEETLKLLNQFEVKHNYDLQTETLTIFGPTPMVGKKNVLPPPDHRMVMVGYLFLRKNSGGELENIEHVKKSFPDFFIQMSKC